LASNKYKHKTRRKTVSNYRKGIRNKRRVRKYYEDLGWAVADVEDLSKYGETDKFGVADLIIIYEGAVRLVQVKSNTPETQATMQRVADKLWVTTCCATWYDHDGLRLQLYKPGADETPWSDVKEDSQEVPSP
jgi:hypothetical protein